MQQKSCQVEELLVLSERLRESQAIFEWTPFSAGETLADLINRHNQLNDQTMAELIPPEFMACIGCVALELAISGLNLRQIESATLDDLVQIKIVLLDTEARPADEVMAAVFKALSRPQQFSHLIQVGQEVASALPDAELAGLRGVLVPPNRIFTNQIQFEEFFGCYRWFQARAWLGVAQNPYDSPCRESLYSEPYIHPRHSHFVDPTSPAGETIAGVYQIYHQNLPELVGQVRDVALARGLTGDQTVTLGQTAAIQEFLLTQVAARARRYPAELVTVRALGRPLLELPVAGTINPQALRETALLAIRRTAVEHGLGEHQGQLMAQLGLAERVNVVVGLDGPELRDALAALDDLVEVSPFYAELPAWGPALLPTGIRLDERAFGLAVEESFCRPYDD